MTARSIASRFSAIAFVLFPFKALSFQSRHTGPHRIPFRQTIWRRPVLPIDPNLALDVGIAVASAAAGAASQLPRVQQLERELSITKEALTQSEQEMVRKITELEEKLFEMDKEFEEQTDRFKKKYDNRMRGELERIKEKIITDYKYKLEIKLEEQKSKLLEERLDFVNTVTSGKAEQLVNLQIEKVNMNRANEELEKALAMSQAELDRLRQEATKKKGWWPFS